MTLNSAPLSQKPPHLGMITGQLFPSPHQADIKKKSVRPLNEQWLSHRLAHPKSMLTLRLLNNPPPPACQDAPGLKRHFFFSIHNVTLKLRGANCTHTYQDLACQLAGSLGMWRTPMACIFNTLITATQSHGVCSGLLLSWRFTVQPSIPMLEITALT